MTRYCIYCGRVAHRCPCAAADSLLRRFLACAEADYRPLWRSTPYKRGVPPQIKRQQRALLRRHYRRWYADLVAAYGEACQHCGQTPNPDDARTALVIDHVLPVAKGGLSVYENVQLLCQTCNAHKGKLYYDCRPDPDIISP